MKHRIDPLSKSSISQNQAGGLGEPQKSAPALGRKLKQRKDKTCSTVAEHSDCIEGLYLTSKTELVFGETPQKMKSPRPTLKRFSHHQPRDQISQIPIVELWLVADYREVGILSIQVSEPAGSELAT